MSVYAIAHWSDPGRLSLIIRRTKNEVSVILMQRKNWVETFDSEGDPIFERWYVHYRTGERATERLLRGTRQDHRIPVRSNTYTDAEIVRWSFGSNEYEGKEAFSAILANVSAIVYMPPWDIRGSWYHEQEKERQHHDLMARYAL